MDFAGSLAGHTFLVSADAFTKWLEVREVNQTTSTAVIAVLRSLFATFGVPQKVVSDNGAAFVSVEMQRFCTDNGVSHITSAPYHPATDGQAERYVGELKTALARDKSGPMRCRLVRFLFRQQNIIHQTTGITPAVAMFERELSAHLDQIKRAPEPTEKQEKLSKNRQLVAGEEVMVRQFLKEPKWISGVFEKQIGPRSWNVRCGRGGVVRRHLNQIRKRDTKTVTDDPSMTLARYLDISNEVETPEHRGNLPKTVVEQRPAQPIVTAPGYGRESGMVKPRKSQRAIRKPR